MIREKARKPVLVVLVRRDEGEYRDLGVHLGGIEHSGPCDDHALLFHLLDAPPARRGGQPDAPADFGDGDGGVLLKDAEDHSIEPVHLAILSFTEARISAAFAWAASILRPSPEKRASDSEIFFRVLLRPSCCTRLGRSGRASACLNHRGSRNLNASYACRGTRNQEGRGTTNGLRNRVDHDLFSREPIRAARRRLITRAVLRNLPEDSDPRLALFHFEQEMAEQFAKTRLSSYVVIPTLIVGSGLTIGILRDALHRARLDVAGACSRPAFAMRASKRFLREGLAGQATCPYGSSASSSAT
jgi:hypothetical protein